MSEQALDFDRGPSWLPALHRHVAQDLPADFVDSIKRLGPEEPTSLQVALPHLLDEARLFASVREWVTARDVLVYHGTRINERQRSAILRLGLLPLNASDRVESITEFLCAHPRWAEVEGNLPEAIDWVRRNAGNRERLVYGCLSRNGLVRGCNHYLVEGPEFDHHVAVRLLGEVSHELNRQRGVGSLVVFRADGAAAIDAANPHEESGSGTNLIAELVAALGWWLATGDDETAAFDEDCALAFKAAISPDRIEAIIPVPDEELWEYYDGRED
ncbi:MAG: hypothetical protein E6Q40_05325 [Cupriavidus sp.]|nr:MAG: hypothetical protein E6Q40_05325 [Cupriavidus sp.]